MDSIRERDTPCGIPSATSGVTVLQCLLQNESSAAVGDGKTSVSSGNGEHSVRMYPCPQPGCKKQYFNEHHLKAHKQFHSRSVATCEPDATDTASSTKYSGLQFLLQNEQVEFLYDEDSESDIVVEEVIMIDEDEDNVLKDEDEQYEYIDDSGEWENSIGEEAERSDIAMDIIQEGPTDDDDGNHSEVVCSFGSLREFKQVVFSTKERRYVCEWPGCIKTYVRSSHLKVHHRKHTGELPFLCTWPGCKLRFARSETLNRHLVTHTCKRDYSCRWCVKRFLRRDHLQEHVRRHNVSSSEFRLLYSDVTKHRDTPKKLPKRPFATRKAKRSPNNRGKTSLPAKERPRNFVCSYDGCEKTYTRLSHLKAHELLHNGIQPFRCPWENCGVAFARSFELSRHRRKHTGERKFVCHICQQAFMRSDHLSSHVKRHTFRATKDDSRKSDQKIELQMNE